MIIFLSSPAGKHNEDVKGSFFFFFAGGRGAGLLHYLVSEIINMYFMN